MLFIVESLSSELKKFILEQIKVVIEVGTHSKKNKSNNLNVWQLQLMCTVNE